MDKTAGALAVNRIMNQFGCLPAAPDGQVIDAFTPEGLGEAIEREANKAREYGFTKITLHLDMPDAVKLAKFLRFKEVD